MTSGERPTVDRPVDCIRTSRSSLCATRAAALPLLTLIATTAAPAVVRSQEAKAERKAGVVVNLQPGVPTLLGVRPNPKVVVPAGRFRMGARGEDLEEARTLCAEELRGGGALRLELGPRCQGRFEGEAPAAEVTVRAFAIDRFEVTVGEHGACVRAGRCQSIPGVTAMEASALPIERASFDDAQDFCRWRGGRLPTEAEWEKAARGSLGRSWPWSGAWKPGRANHGRAERSGLTAAASEGEDALDDRDGHAGAAPVGSFPRGASPYGALDMAGNVWEWTSGFFSRDPPQARTRFQPLGPVAGTERTVRGGSYRSPPSDLRTTRRMGLAPSERQAGVGFRCAYDL